MKRNPMLLNFYLDESAAIERLAAFAVERQLTRPQAEMLANVIGSWKRGPIFVRRYGVTEPSQPDCKVKGRMAKALANRGVVHYNGAANFSRWTAEALAVMDAVSRLNNGPAVLASTPEA